MLIAHKWELDTLQDNTKSILVSRHAFVFNDARVREALDKIHLPHEGLNLVLLQTLQPYSLDGDHLASVQVQSPIHRPELSAPDAVA